MRDPRHIPAPGDIAVRGRPWRSLLVVDVGPDEMVVRLHPRLDGEADTIRTITRRDWVRETRAATFGRLEVPRA